MLRDIVVDTNVFVHSANPRSGYYTSAMQLVSLLQHTTTSLCIDEGFDADATKNRSLLAHEYYANLNFGTIAFAVIAYLAASGRVKQVSRVIPPRLARKVRQLINNRRDRTFVHVTHNSIERVLASHDFQDFTFDVRDELRAREIAYISTAHELIDDEQAFTPGE